MVRIARSSDGFGQSQAISRGWGEVAPRLVRIALCVYLSPVILLVLAVGGASAVAEGLLRRCKGPVGRIDRSLIRIRVSPPEATATFGGPSGRASSIR